MNQDKRLIEETFPVKEVSSESAREKYIRHGHISTLHIWWARKPLAVSRATAYAALTSVPKDISEWSQKREFIINLSKWENSLNPQLIQQAREDILKANGGIPPKVLDPFSGGGSIPLEASRLGCETYSNDLNPVAVLIQKCILEYPQRYGKPEKVTNTDIRFGGVVRNPLLEDVKKWGTWVLEAAKKELERFYPKDTDGSNPVGYIWARTIPCQNPSCGTEIPLMGQFWLSRKKKKKVALFPYYQEIDGIPTVQFKIVGDGYELMPDGFNPAEGTISRAVVVCPVCGGTVEAKLTRKLFQEKKAGQRVVAVIMYKPGTSGKRYRVVTDTDRDVFQSAEVSLMKKREKLFLEWGVDPVPDEPTPEGKGRGAERAFSVRNYGMNVWGDLFNARQKLALITFTEKVRAAYQKMLKEGVDGELAKILVNYLGILIDRLAAKNSNLVCYHVVGEKIEQVFGRQVLGMMWNYAELNPFADVGWHNMQKWVERVIEHCSQSSVTSTKITQGSATNLLHSDNFFDAVFTDPPYYDNVPYSYLSDFFYVWLKRALGDVYPELFSTPLTPNKNEIVAYSNGPGGFEAGKRFFEESLKLSFQEIHRVLKPNGVAVIVYAHKSTEGWETLINSLLDSGLIMTGAWPISTEMTSRLRAQESAVLASSIYIVARKIEREPTGFYNEVKEEMTTHLNARLHRLWEEGLSGADFFIAAIGSAIEVFGKYEKVIDFEGEVIRADRLLDDVREIATDYAVRQILHNGFAGEISDLTRFYVLWRWEYGEARVPFDEARKLAQSCGIDISQEWSGNSFVKKEKQFIRVLGPQTRTLNDLSDTDELIDVLHHVLLLWEKSQRDEMLHILRDSGFGDSEAFYRVAQAISETLPIENREKKLLDGFLAGREKVREDIRQGQLF